MKFKIQELNDFRDKLSKKLIPYCNGAPFLYMDTAFEEIDFLQHFETYYCKTQLGFIIINLN